MTLSFIVIGKNEEKNIPRCIRSIHNAMWAYRMARNNINHEIIYVDADSTDNSAIRAKLFYNVEVFKIIGKSNAANGRNIGAKQAKGKWLFFIDADMELDKNFLLTYFDPTYRWQEKFVFGQWYDVINGKERLRKMSDIHPGGSFLIKKSLWDQYQMDSSLSTGEEADMTLRMHNIGFRRKRVPMVKHYTVPYLSKERLWERIKNKSIFCSKSVTYRRHFFKSAMWRLLWNNDKTTIFLILTILSFFLVTGFGLSMFIIYICLILIRAKTNSEFVSTFQIASSYLITDILNIIYFFTYYPKKLSSKFERL